MSSDGFKFKNEDEKFFNSNWLTRYEVLRVITKIDFLDYNLLDVFQSFHIQDNYKSISKINGQENIIDTSFFALPEKYTTKEILMHNTSAYINNKEVAITESNKLNLVKLNNLNIMYSSMSIINRVKQTIESELKNFSKKLSTEDLVKAILINKAELEKIEIKILIGFICGNLLFIFLILFLANASIFNVSVSWLVFPIIGIVLVLFNGLIITIFLQLEVNYPDRKI